MSETRITVCMATYNGAAYLREQVDSIIHQLREGDELVVSDDGSRDATLQILQSYGNRVRIVGFDRAGGVVKNFERALTAAQGEMIVLSDQDDVWLDGRLAFIRERLRHVPLLMMNGIVVDERLVPTGEDIHQMVSFRGGFFKTFLSTKYVGCCMAFRRQLLDIALPFPSNILWHDWYIALLAELFYRTELADRKTILFRRHGANASTTGQKSTNSLAKKLMSRFWMARAILIASARRTRIKLEKQR